MKHVFFALVAVVCAVGSVFAHPWEGVLQKGAPAAYPTAITGAVRSVMLEGEAYRGKPTRFFAWYGLPAGARANKKVPGVVLVHGGDGTAYDWWVKMWNERGYAAIAMDNCGALPVRDPATKRYARHEFSGPAGWGCFGQIDEPLADQWTYHAIADVIRAHTFLRSLPEVDAARIGVTGISWGGYLTCIAAGVDGRYQWAAPVYGCGYYLDEGCPWKKELEQLGEKGRKWMATWDASVYLPGATCPFLWVNGMKDHFFKEEMTRKSAALTKGPKFYNLRPDMVHGHGSGSRPWELQNFADHFAFGRPLDASIGEKWAVKPSGVDPYRVTKPLCADAPATGPLAILPALPERQWTHGMWLPRFDAKKTLATTGSYDVVFLGDSITHFWETHGQAVWAKHFAEGPYKALNCGISGDRTEHILWRLDHGQFGNLNPKAIVLMIGTNNTGHRDDWQEPPVDTILGVQSVLDRLTARFPDAKVILHPIFPRGATTNDPMRVRNDVVNQGLKMLANGGRIAWCDFNARLVTADGTLEKAMAPDFLHPREKGYEIWAEEVIPYLDWALGRGKRPAAAKAEMPTALAAAEPKTCVPAIHRHWLANANPKVEPRLRNKRIEKSAHVAHYYDLMMLGDSITHFWDRPGNREGFEEKFAGYDVFNFGFGGNKTEHVLWNLLYGGALDSVHTRLVTLMIGTNNVWSDTPEDIAAGVAACVKVIRAKQPQAKLLLIPILPREVARNRNGRNYRRDKWGIDPDLIMPKIGKVNELLRPLADGTHVVWFDLTAEFTDKEGLPNLDLLVDGTHPSPAGYAVWADKLLPYLKAAVGR